MPRARHSSNRYLQRLIEDEELRSSLLSAYGAARSAYGRMSNGKPAAQALFEDRKLQQELKDAAERAARSLELAARAAQAAAAAAAAGSAARCCCSRSARSLAIALSEGLRTKVLDLLFGAEEEFDYSSTTAPETPAPAAVASG